MRIAMLGWEFPPFIAGGLGTACYGLTKALDLRGHEILFVLPRPVDRSHASHVRLFSPAGRATSAAAPVRLGPVDSGAAAAIDFDVPVYDPRTGHLITHAAAASAGLTTMQPFAHTTFMGVAAGFSSPYRSFSGARSRAVSRPVIDASGNVVGEELIDEEWAEQLLESAPKVETRAGPMFGASGAGSGYKGDLFAESERYARMVVAQVKGEAFDVIHAHDWLTFSAGAALAGASGRPLIVHVHSTEFDRSGENINRRVYEVERRGMRAAMRVVCVSELTRNIVVSRYGIAPDRVDVVYNGIDAEQFQPRPGDQIASKDKIVLFLGRITMQKGPEYFIGAAKRVLEKVPNTKFIIAGSGDMELRMIELAAHLGIGHRVLFTGFLRGRDVDRVYQMADCYVMPSVSEPFGIAPLEAMRNDVPVIISKQSGVSEVLTHALKVDFWDTDEMANKIVAVLRHPPLGQTLRQHGSFELRRLTWAGAAERCEQVYQRVLEGQRDVALV
ncbi:MAG: glycosyltransferase [Phycisphaerales bacterium]